jgi:hypothetical protein
MRVVGSRGAQQGCCGHGWSVPVRSVEESSSTRLKVVLVSGGREITGAVLIRDMAIKRPGGTQRLEGGNARLKRTFALC